MGQVPYLEVDSKPLAQSCAIARYLASEFGEKYASLWLVAITQLTKKYSVNYVTYHMFLLIYIVSSVAEKKT